MFTRLFTAVIIAFLLATGLPSICNAQAFSDEEDPNIVGGFAKPYEYERQAYGYDPEGVEYKENQTEDFQVIFITSAPFTAMASFVIYGTVSLITDGSFGVGGDYFWPFIGTAALGSTAIACTSVLTNPYPPPSHPIYSADSMQPKTLAFEVPLITARF
jgi:hypothetical protein